MSQDLFKLRPIQSPHLDSATLQGAIDRIGKLTEGWEVGGTASIAGLLDEFRSRMRAGLLKGLSFDECTSGRRREWLLLNLYLIDLGAEESRKWLPPLDNKIVVSILGENPGRLRRHFRRLATQLYFTHYGMEGLPC